MLAFFRKYEKTFLLLIFAPALLTLGISTAMLDVFSRSSDMQAGTVFGEPVSMSEFSRVAEPYRRVNPYVDDDAVWKFYVLYRAAQRAGISVTDEEVGQRIASQKRFDIARAKAEEEVVKEGLRPGSREFQQRMSQLLMKYMLEEPLAFDRENYRKYGVPEGMSIREYEAHEKREALVSRYLDTLRELATVTPDEVWKEYQDQHHRRAAELVTVVAKDHIPDVAVVSSDDPRVISDEQVREYFDVHQDDYEEPRRAKLEFLGVVLADLQVAEPKAEDAKAYFELRRASIAGVTSASTFETLEDKQRDQVFDMLESERRQERADEVMSAVAARVQAAEKAGEKTPDLAKLAAEVEKETGAKLERGTTDLLEKQGVLDHPVLGSDAGRFWFESREPGETSDVLAGPKAWFVVRSLEVKHNRMPTFEEVKAKAREDYAKGSQKERQRYYDEHKGQKYMGEPAWKLEYLVANSADYAAGGNDGSEAAKKALQTFLDIYAEKNWRSDRDFTLNRVYQEERVEKASLIELVKADKEWTRAAIDQDPVLGHAADVIGSFEERALPSAPYARKDGKGWVVFRVMDRVAPKVKALSEVEAQVTADLQSQRGLERAKAWTERLSGELQGLSEAEAKALLQKKGLNAAKTAPFGRDETKLEGFPAAARIVAAAFESEVKPGGPFSKVVELADHEQGARVVLLRVAERVDAPKEEFAQKYSTLRADVLRRIRGEYSAAETRKTFLAAMGIGEAHLTYARKLRDAPNGATKLRVRQIFIPPDRAVVDAWLDEKATAIVQKAQAELASGKSWEAVVDKYSEDEVTRARKGDLPPVGRGQLLEEFGADFEETVFDLRQGQVSKPVRSDRGWHLVRRIREADGGKTVFSHLLIKTTPEARNMPAEVRDQAEKVAKAKAEDALKQLEAGASFADVAEKLGDVKDTFGQGQPFDMDYVTPFERAALAQPLEWEGKEGEERPMTWLPEAVELPTGENGASEWHLFACARDRHDGGIRDAAEARRDRSVFHIVSPTREGAAAARERIEGWLQDFVAKEEDRPSWPAILDKVREVAREASRAPDAEKGGAVGFVQLEGSVRAYGDAFYDAVCRKADGSPVAAGHRTGIVRGEQGFHIAEVIEVVMADEKRQDEVAELVLRGTDWK